MAINKNVPQSAERGSPCNGEWLQCDRNTGDNP